MAEKPEALRLGVLNGPNLNLLGWREPENYGLEELEAINLRLSSRAEELGVELDFYQSDIEGDLVEWIQQASGRLDGLRTVPPPLLSLRHRCGSYRWLRRR